MFCAWCFWESCKRSSNACSLKRMRNSDRKTLVGSSSAVQTAARVIRQVDVIRSPADSLSGAPSTKQKTVNCMEALIGNGVLLGSLPG